jgi:hypothetical protein
MVPATGAIDTCWPRTGRGAPGAVSGRVLPAGRPGSERPRSPDPDRAVPRLVDPDDDGEPGDALAPPEAGAPLGCELAVDPPAGLVVALTSAWTPVAGAETEGTDTGGTDTDGTEMDGTEMEGIEIGGIETDGTEIGGIRLDWAATARTPAPRDAAKAVPLPVPATTANTARPSPSSARLSLGAAVRRPTRATSTRSALGAGDLTFRWTCSRRSARAPGLLATVRGCAGSH